MAFKPTKKLANRLCMIGGVIVVLSGIMFIGSLLNVFGDINTTACSDGVDNCKIISNLDRNLLISRGVFLLGVIIALTGVGIMMSQDLRAKKK